MSTTKRKHSTDPIVDAIRDVFREEIEPLREDMNRRFEGVDRQFVSLKKEMQSGFLEINASLKELREHNG